MHAFISSAKKSLDMTMYELVDTTAQQELVDEADNGVKVRVILDKKQEGKQNDPAFDFLKQHGVQVVWPPEQFKATHQKTIVADGTALILTGNLTSRYYSTTRDFGVVDRDSRDVSAMEQTFNSDFAHQQITPENGSDLVWSPTISQTFLLGLIKSAQSSLSIENEEMADDAVVQALVDATKRGVKVKVTMANGSSRTDSFSTLSRAGVGVATYSNNAKLYIHAKVLIVDAGEPNARAFLGSQNFSDASLNARSWVCSRSILAWSVRLQRR